MKKTLLTALMTMALAVIPVVGASATSYSGKTVEPESDGKTYSVTAVSGDTVTLNNAGKSGNALAVTFKNTVSGQIVVTQSAAKPDSAPTAAPGTIDLYFDVSLSGLTNDDIGSAKWRFDVPKSFMTTNGVTAANIFLHHYNGSAWERLTTREISSTETTTTFEADVNNFSPFAVSAVAGLSNTGSPYMLGAIVSVAILATLAGTFYLSRKSTN